MTMADEHLHFFSFSWFVLACQRNTHYSHSDSKETNFFCMILNKLPNFCFDKISECELCDCISLELGCKQQQ